MRQKTPWKKIKVIFRESKEKKLLQFRTDYKPMSLTFGACTGPAPQNLFLTIYKGLFISKNFIKPAQRVKNLSKIFDGVTAAA